MAGNVYRGLTIELNAKTTALSTALRQSEREAKSLQRELKAVEKASNLDGMDTAAANRKMELLSQSIDNATEKLNRLKDAEGKYGESGMSTDAWTKLQYEIEKTESDIEGFRTQMKQLAIEQGASDSALGKMGSTLTELGEKLDPIGEKMTSIGNKLTVGVTVPLVAAGTATVKAAVDIDTALTGVRKTVDGTEEDYQRLKEAAIEFSKTNAVSAEQVLNAQALGAQLGFTLDELDKFAEVATGLEIATDMGLEDAATEMAQFANITGMAHDEIENYASAIVNVGNNMATTESKVSSMAQRIAAASHQVGMTEAEIIGWSGTMSSLGIEAEAGGTAFSTFVANIDTAVATGGASLEAFAGRAGMSADEFSEAWKTSSTDALQALLEGIGEADNMSIALEELGVTGIRQTDVMKRLASNTELVAQGIALANDGWKDNTALSNEVANKNDSLASKFEMLKNRVIAVAEQVGKPLADAMLEAIDAAEPLFEAIENGAKAFSEMSEGEQRAVIQTVAIIAALGPSLSLFGKVTSSVSTLGKALTTLSRMFATVDVNTGGAASGIRKVADESGKTVTKVEKASVAMGALKTAAIGLALAGIAVLISEIAKYTDHLQKVNAATNGLKAAMDTLGTGGAVKAFDSAGSAAKSYKDQVNDAIEAHADLSESIGDLYRETETNAGLADHYLQAIKDAQESYDGSAEACARLQAAVDGYNDATGSSLEITDKQTGALSTSTQTLEANTEAWKANARAQAAMDAYKEIYAENAKAHEAEAAAYDAVSAAEQAYADAVKRHASAGELNKLDKAVNDAKNTAADATRVVQQSDAALLKAENQVVEYTEAAKTASQTTDDFRNALAWSADGVSDFDAMAKRLGVDVDDLSSRLSTAGISTTKLASIGTDNFEKLYEAANGDINAIGAALGKLDEMDVDPKDVEVTDNGTIRVVSDKCGELELVRFGTKWVTIEAYDRATSVINDIKWALSGLDDVIFSITGWSMNAAGGISRRPIRRFAEGAIIDRPTLTNVGIVGEAGAEAIIPLTNRAYVRPFAQAVAAEMGGATHNSATYDVSIVVNAETNADPDEIASATARRVKQVLASRGRS